MDEKDYRRIVTSNLSIIAVMIIFITTMMFFDSSGCSPRHKELIRAIHKLNATVERNECQQ